MYFKVYTADGMTLCMADEELAHARGMTSFMNQKKNEERAKQIGRNRGVSAASSEIKRKAKSLETAGRIASSYFDSNGWTRSRVFSQYGGGCNTAVYTKRFADGNSVTYRIPVRVYPQMLADYALSNPSFSVDDEVSRVNDTVQRAKKLDKSVTRNQNKPTSTVRERQESRAISQREAGNAAKRAGENTARRLADSRARGEANRKRHNENKQKIKSLITASKIAVSYLENKGWKRNGVKHGVSGVTECTFTNRASNGQTMSITVPISIASSMLLEYADQAPNLNLDDMIDRINNDRERAQKFDRKNPFASNRRPLSDETIG